MGMTEQSWRSELGESDRAKISKHGYAMLGELSAVVHVAKSNLSSEQYEEISFLFGNIFEQISTNLIDD